MARKVLVVDSDFRTRMQAISAVMSAGYQANIAESTMEAVAAAASDRPDLVLIGDSLTGPSGLALVGRLFSDPATADLPVLVVADSPDARTAAEKAGARGVLNGPVTASELLAAIAAHIETPGPIAGAPASVLSDAHRLAAVDALRSSWREQDGLDRFAALASQMLAAPVSTVSLIDSERQLFASQLGMSEPWASAGEIPLEYSYCQFAVTSRQPLRINNATVHPLVQGSPAVAGVVPRHPPHHG